MPITTEILNTTFSDLRPPLQVAFKRRDPLWRVLDDKAKIDQNTGSLIERTFTGTAPARGVGIFDGFELLNMVRVQRTRRYRVEPARLVVAINIPKKELNYNTGNKAVIKLIENYPQAVLMGMKTDIDSYMLSGVSRGIVFATAELRGLLSLNGQVTTGLGTGVANGLLDFAASTAQADSVQDVAKSVADQHFNQFADIPAWATSGMRTERAVYRQCSAYADDGEGPDITLMDPDVFANFEEAKLSFVRTVVVEDKTEKTETMELSLGLSKVYYAPSLLRANFTGVAADGVTYMLNSDYLELPVSEDINVSDFRERVGDQDVVTAVAAWQGNLVATRLPPHGCVSGGAA